MLSLKPLRLFSKNPRKKQRNSSPGIARVTPPASTADESSDMDAASTTSQSSSAATEDQVPCYCAPQAVVVVQPEDDLHQAIGDADQDGCGMECNICLSEINATCKSVDTLPCGHSFHRGCLTDWRFVHNTCPCCRCSLEYVEMHC